MRSQRSIVLSYLLIVVIVVSGTVNPTYALATDSDRSYANSVEGGVIDMKLSETGEATENSTLDETDADSLNATWKDTAHADSETVNNTITIENNESTISIVRINITVLYTEEDSALGVSGNAVGTAESIEVRSFIVNGTDLVGTEITDENGNNQTDVDDLTQGETAKNLSSLPGIASAATGELTIVFDGNPSLVGDTAAGNGINIQIDIQGHNSSFLDVDRTKNNTIIYG